MILKLIFLFLLFCSIINAQTIQYTKTGGGNSDDTGYALCTDSQGNVYTAGSFRNTSVFDGTTVVSHGHYDLFVAKYNSSGTMLWIKTGGGSAADEIFKLRMSEDGFIYAYGHFAATMQLGSISLTATGDPEAEDVFLFKMNTDGDFLWAKAYGGISQNFASDLQIKGNNIIMTGTYVTNEFVAGDITLPAVPGIYPGFILKTDANGVPQWAKITGGDSYIAMDENSIYMATFLTGTRTFEGITLVSDGPSDILLSSYDYNGNRGWFKQFGGSGNDRIRSVCYNAATNSIYLGGEFNNTMQMGSNSLVSNGQYDIFVSRFDIQGNNIWAKSYGGAGIDFVNASTIDAQGNFYIAGYFMNTVNFGNVSISAVGQNDAYAAKFSPNGDFQWVRNGGGPDNDNVFDIKLGANSDIYFIGFFRVSATFGSQQISSSGSSDYYQVKIANITGIGSPGETVSSFRLDQNYPNPFNPSTKISFNIDKPGLVKLTVLDISGKEVAQLVNASVNSGSYSVNFSADNLAGGIYFYRIETANGTDTKKMILIK